ncbi:MAG: hypothetical protein II119_02850 [Bacilli bacterium]|nr:hypothetical protein [Bacilli bacterium]MBQ6282580.1 hypothetical protein [Bacilli bacterium]
MNKKTFIGITIFVVLILLIIFIKVSKDKNGKDIFSGNLTTIYVAAGGGKEDFLADSDVKKILKNKYKIEVVYDTWSNGKTITKPLIRESVGLGDSAIAREISEGETYTINSSGVSKYDALFTSDQRFYDYYKLFPNKELGESDRYTVLDGGLTLNTPIVIYSWREVVDALINEKIVTLDNGVYYITDMNKLINYILTGKKWKDIGLSNLYGTINIASTDPVTSSPGATYYGLLLSILSESQVTSENIEKNLPKLKEFYIKSGYMNNTPADLFERYLKTGMGGEPMIVDYEKSMIDFANSSPDAFNQVKDEIRVLYPTPTIWNSHCFTVFTENGKKLYEALNDKEIGQIAWSKYGFRTGVTGGTYDVSGIGIGVPQSITSTVSSLKMDTYNKLIDYLKEN